MRAIWSGSISFGLVNIPIKLYSAVQHKSIGFKLLHKKDNSPIKYKRFCEKEEKEVKWDDIVKGLQIAKGKYYILTKEELDKLKPEKSDYIDIIEFVDSGEVDPIYFNSHYYVAPENEGDKAYFLFREVLQSTGKVAIGKYVMRDKEYACTLAAYQKGLILSNLNYEYEIRDINDIEEIKNSPKLRPEEIDLAKQLINKLYKENFDISKFKDTFVEQLKESIKKVEEKGYVEIGKTKIKKTSNLMEALKSSLK